MNSPRLNSLGFDKAPADTRIVVAMSGGVDSSVVAAMLAAEGYDVVGITLQLYDQGAAAARKGACCAGQDIHDARRTAEKLGIPHYVLDYEERFRKSVIAPFADSYARGETPVPCIDCNRSVKFRDLIATARDLGADALATGHYARRIMGKDGPELHRAIDATRDQSYFLFATTRAQLDYLRLPLGGLSKTETRETARKLGLAVAEKADSQDICFVPSGSYTRIVNALRPDTAAPGEIVHLDGRVLGRHDGVVNYTIGQRKGLGIGADSADSEPLFVIRLDPAGRRVIVGPRKRLGRDRAMLRDINWLGSGDAIEPGMDVQVKYRSSQAPVAGSLSPLSEGGAEIVFDEPQAAVAPGQACVFYDGDRVLGGGWIKRDAVSAALSATRLDSSLGADV